MNVSRSPEQPAQDAVPEIAGECPHCLAVVAYEDWGAVVEEPELMACPCCRRACQVDAVFPLQRDEH